MTTNKDEIRKQLAQDHNWSQQEKHWQSQQKHWLENEQHWQSQRAHWKIIAVAAIIAVFFNFALAFIKAYP